MEILPTSRDVLYLLYFHFLTIYYATTDNNYMIRLLQIMCSKVFKLNQLKCTHYLKAYAPSRRVGYTRSRLWHGPLDE